MLRLLAGWRPDGPSPLPQAPKPKPPTRWEEFAAMKGIQNRKRSRMVFDELSQEYKPRYGYVGLAHAIVSSLTEQHVLIHLMCVHNGGFQLQEYQRYF